MPRVRQLTETMRSEQDQKIQSERAERIIRGATVCAGLSLVDISNRTRIPYTTLMRHLHEGTLTAEEVGRIGKVLRFEPETYAAVCGAPDRCRYEAGWKT
jgi:hypothetical protein